MINLSCEANHSRIKDKAKLHRPNQSISLLETQEIELQEIKSRQDASVKRMSKKISEETKEEDQVHQTKEQKEVNPMRLMDDQKTTQLMESTENMMKFGFSSMSMSYFTAVILAIFHTLHWEQLQI